MLEVQFVRNCLLGALYMGSGTGRLPGRDVLYLGFKNWLCGRRVGMFVGRGRFSCWDYIIMFLPGTISPGTIRKISIISSLQSGRKCLYDKNCPTFVNPGSVNRDPSLPVRGTKNVPTKLFPYKRNGTNKRYHCIARSRLTSFRPGKRPVRLTYN